MTGKHACDKADIHDVFKLAICVLFHFQFDVFKRDIFNRTRHVTENGSVFCVAERTADEFCSCGDLIVFAVSCAVDRAAEHVIFVKKRFKYICAEIYRRNFDVRFQKFVYVFLHCLGGIFLAEQIVIKSEIVNRRD